ncbi:including n-acetylases of ribosomal protein [Exidia glandulosa HHB12029]|uniref:Including n-acetylases of ribosomal protein n=1 Tax=Exidia glandulosa HHB12029 TaxID=1314781 RepID=A0A165L6V1_EXIGL|nr:including n-acetylases of ribosomal protein [Exidia glandulosa HHB12029]
MPDTPFVIETSRLYITHWDPASQKHCAFLVRLFACESFRLLGDNGIRTEEDARAHITNRMVSHYEKHGYTGMLVSLKPSDASDPCTSSDLERSEPIGFSSLIIHGEHTLPDVGFGFLDEAQGKGYATEAARALVNYAQTTLGIPHILAFCNPENTQSRKAIERLGFTCFGAHEIKALPGQQTMVWASPGVRNFEELKRYNVY